MENLYLYDGTLIYESENSKQYPLEVIKKPTERIVELEDAKKFMREDRDIENEVIESLIKTAGKMITIHTGYHLLNTDLKLHMKRFEDIRIPKRPYVKNTIVVNYYDETGTKKVLSTDKYDVLDMETPVKIEFKDNLPSVDEDKKYAVNIDFTAGYGDNSTDVPEDWKTAVKLLALIYFKRDIPTDEDNNINPLQVGIIKTLLSDYRISRFH